MNPGSAAPDRWEAAAVDANTDWMCLFLDGRNQSLILSSQSVMAVSAVSACCVGNHVVLANSPPIRDRLGCRAPVRLVVSVQCAAPAVSHVMTSGIVLVSFEFVLI